MNGNQINKENREVQLSIHISTIAEVLKDVKELRKQNKALRELLTSESVLTLLRFGVKSPSRSGMDECEDDGYYDLYQLAQELLKGGEE